MARYIGPKLKLARREGTDLYHKSGVRPIDSKCRIDNPPGQHGARRTRLSDYAVQLREKQKVRRMYGILERQFRRYFHNADLQKGATGANLLIILERRLDNVIFRLGFANSRDQARQLVLHGTFMLNGRRVSVPSQQVKAGDVIEVREEARKIPVITEAQDVVGRRGLPEWLEADAPNFKGMVKALPTREDIQLPINEQLIVELYSK